MYNSLYVGQIQQLWRSIILLWLSKANAIRDMFYLLLSELREREHFQVQNMTLIIIVNVPLGFALQQFSRNLLGEIQVFINSW